MGVHRLKDASPAAPRLTQQVSCSGCAAKIPVQMLTKILGSLPPPPKSKRILVGPETWDDAGVYRVNATLALVQTIDFFTPMVDDPYDFGAIAAANSVSDVYAMGGVPKTALSVLCFPAEGGDPAVLRDIVRGGADLLRRAGVFVLGGHSVRDPEIKFGYAVTGEVHPKRVVTNAGARAGDVLVLTKPLGVGILATALKRDLLPGPLLTRMTRQMKSLNRAAAAAMTASGAHAATDVTGFGLIGHARNMARASGKTIRLWSRTIPLLPGVLDLAARDVVSAGLRSNRESVDPDVVWDESVSEPLRCALVDPQTSGGLLIAIQTSKAGALMRRLSRARVSATVVGEVLARRSRMIEVAA